jgi:predicted nucleotidyltransferase
MEKKIKKDYLSFKSPNDCSMYYVNEAVDSIINESRDGYAISVGELKKIRKSKKIDLKSFEIQDELNPKIWLDNGLINSRVRLRLLDIADTFIDGLEVDWVKIDDIILTGSLANYNWSKYSDFDVHVIIDFKDVDERTEFVANYFNSKKKIWNNEHENLKIYGFPVEMYVQDKNEEHTSSGVYSLEKNKWLVKPERDNIKRTHLDKEYIKNKVKDIISVIDNLDEKIKTEKDEYKLEQLSKKVKLLFDKIKGNRKESLRKYGEMSTGNIIFKSLRRLGYIDRIYNMKLNTYDKIKSIN